MDQMNPTLKAILARNGFDVRRAELYCVQMAAEYPHLRQEYGRYAYELSVKVEAAHV